MTSEKGGTKKRKFRGLSYSMRVTLMFALMALMTALIVAGVLAFAWEGEFQTYTRANLSRIATSTASSVADRYEMSRNWNDDVFMTIRSAERISAELEFQLISNDDEILYDSRLENRDEASKDNDDNSNLTVGSPTDKTIDVTVMGAEAVSIPVEVDDQQVATLMVRTSNADSFLTSADIDFRADSYQALIIAAAIAIVLASILGFFFSRTLVMPIERITYAATAIADGDLTARTGMKGKDEISQLGLTFDEMAESIERDRQLERRLTTDVAHELRTPLMAIQATVEAMQDGVLPADELRLSTVRSETMRLERLVEALLTLSRLENRSASYEEETLDLREIISGLVVTHEALLEASDIKMIYEPADEPVIIRADRDMIRQATANLISNAIRYTDAGGTVTVRVFLATNKLAAIAVEDTGIGISQENISRVFSRFWRADESRNRSTAGVGVGLSIVYEIVEMHHGRIDVQSVEGKGSTFTILLPRYIDPNEQARGKKSGTSKQTTARMRRVAASEKVNTGKMKKINVPPKQK